jgi:hypothetical protein
MNNSYIKYQPDDDLVRPNYVVRLFLTEIKVGDHCRCIQTGCKLIKMEYLKFIYNEVKYIFSNVGPNTNEPSSISTRFKAF